VEVWKIEAEKKRKGGKKKEKLLRDYGKDRIEIEGGSNCSSSIIR